MRPTPVPQYFPGNEALSAFFVGLLYFIAQWMWQMQNYRDAALLPWAYILLIGVSLQGAASWHVLLVYATTPTARLRVFNAFLFTPFLLVGALSYPGARATALLHAPALGQTPSFLPTPMVFLLGALIGILPLFLHRLLGQVESRLQADDGVA